MKVGFFLVSNVQNFIKITIEYNLVISKVDDKQIKAHKHGGKLFTFFLMKEKLTGNFCPSLVVLRFVKFRMISHFGTYFELIIWVKPNFIYYLSKGWRRVIGISGSLI